MIIKGTSRIKDFLKAPGEVKALLLHGADMGLAGARARSFAVSEGSPLTIDYQTAEEDAVSKATLCVDMFNPPSVVVVKNVKTAPDGFFRDLLTRERLEVRLAIIADRLTPSNKLRNFFETSKELAAIGCYPLQGRELRRAIVDFVQAAGGNIGEDALSFLTSCLPEDWGLVESELGKLLAYADGEKITTQAAEKCLGNEKIAALDELSDALGGGDKKTALTLLEKLLKDLEPATIAHGVGSHFTALARAGLMVKSGIPTDSALMKLEPPIFYPRKAAFIRQMRRLSPSIAAKRAADLLEVEILAKSGRLASRPQVLNGLMKAAD